MRGLVHVGGTILYETVLLHIICMEYLIILANTQVYNKKLGYAIISGALTSGQSVCGRFLLSSSDTFDMRANNVGFLKIIISLRIQSLMGLGLVKKGMDSLYGICILHLSFVVRQVWEIISYSRMLCLEHVGVIQPMMCQILMQMVSLHGICMSHLIVLLFLQVEIITELRILCMERVGGITPYELVYLHGMCIIHLIKCMKVCKIRIHLRVDCLVVIGQMFIPNTVSLHGACIMYLI